MFKLPYIKSLVAILLLSTSYSAFAEIDVQERDRQKLGVTYEVEYNDGMWIKAGCVYITLSSLVQKGILSFDHIQVSAGFEKKPIQGISIIKLATTKDGNRVFSKNCFSIDFLKGSIFGFMYTTDKSSPPLSHAVLSGEVIAEASIEALKKAGRTPKRAR